MRGMLLLQPADKRSHPMTDTKKKKTTKYGAKQITMCHCN